MNHKISNGIITLEVAEKGAEMMSVKKDGGEYLWQGNPEFWSGRACNLFPICGRLTDGKYTYKGKTYEMILHGFAKISDFVLKEQTENKLVFSLKSNEEIKKIYPFDFEYTVTYILDGNKINTEYNVTNLGNETMYFAFGGHPGFNVPLNGEGKFEDYYVEFAEATNPRKLIFEGCYMSDKTEPFALVNGVRLNLMHNLFDDDAIFLTNVSKKVTLASDKSQRSVIVEYPNMQYVGFWHKPEAEAPYVCIEPWMSVPAYYNVIDDLETKRDMTKLEAGKSFKNNIMITIK